MQSEGQPLPPPSPDATPNTNIPAPLAEQVKNLPDLSELPGMDALGESMRRQDDAEDAFLTRGAHNPNIAAAEARAAVEAAHGEDSPVNLGGAIAATADMSKNPAGLTFANSPSHTVRLGGPNNLPTSPGIRQSEVIPSVPPATGLIDGVPPGLK